MLTLDYDLTLANEATSIYSILGHWNESISAGNEFWGKLRLSVGYRREPWHIQRVYREEAYSRFSNDTASLLYLTHNRLPLQLDRSFELSILPERMASEGLRLGYNLVLHPRLWITPSFSFLRPVNLLQGELSGNATAVAANDYDFDFNSDLNYRVDPLFGRENTGLSGRGYALDIELAYRFDEQWSVRLTFLDLYAKFRLNNTPYTSAMADSTIKEYDDNDYVIYNPLVSGIEGFRDMEYEPSTQTLMLVRYRLSNSSLLWLSYFNWHGLDLMKLGYAYDFGEFRVEARWIPENQALVLSFSDWNADVSLDGDSLNHKKTKYTELRSSQFWQF